MGRRKGRERQGSLVRVVVHRVPAVAQRLHFNTSGGSHTPYISSFVGQLAIQKFVFVGLGVIVLRTLPFFDWSTSKVGFPQGFPKRIGHNSGVRAGEGPGVAGTAGPRNRRSSVWRDDARCYAAVRSGGARMSSRDGGAGEER